MLVFAPNDHTRESMSSHAISHSFLSDLPKKRARELHDLTQTSPPSHAQTSPSHARASPSHTRTSPSHAHTLSPVDHAKLDALIRACMENIRSPKHQKHNPTQDHTKSHDHVQPHAPVEEKTRRSIETQDPNPDEFMRPFSHWFDDSMGSNPLWFAPAVSLATDAEVCTETECELKDTLSPVVLPPLPIHDDEWTLPDLFL